MKDMSLRGPWRKFKSDPEDENEKTKGTERGNADAPSRTGNSYRSAGAGCKERIGPYGWAVVSG